MPVKRQNKEPWQIAWEREIDAKTPALSEYVKNEPLPTVEKRRGGVAAFLAALSSRKLAAAAGVLAMLIITVTLVIFLRPDDPTVPTPPDFSNTVMAVEINPGVLMSTDKDGRVSSVVALNEDADTVMSLEEFSGEVIGKPMPEAIKAYTDLCARLGFISYSGDAVRLSGTSEAELSDAANALSAYFKDSGIFAVVATQSKGEAELGAAYGIDTEGGLYSAVSQMQSYYTKRRDAGKELPELIDEYEADILEYVEIYIKEEIEKRLSGLDGYYAQIMEALLAELARNAEQLKAVIESLEGLLDENVLPDVLDDFVALPSSQEEYFLKLDEYIKFRSGELKSRFAEEYGAVREKIKDSDYEDYIEEIIASYGSLNSYFESQK